MNQTCGTNRWSYLTYLRRLLLQRLTLSELQTLCFDLDIDVESLPGGGSKLDLVRGLVDYLERRERTSDLVAYLPKFRDDIQLRALVPASDAVGNGGTAATWEVSSAQRPPVPVASVLDPQQLWSYALPGQPMAAPLILGDVALIASQESGRGAQGGVLRALGLTKGDVRWEQRFPSAVIGGMSRVNETRVLVSLSSLGHGSGESALVAVDATGKIAWRAACDVDQISAPARCGAYAAVSGNARAVILVDGVTGEQSVHASMPVDVALSAPACDGATIYVPCRAPSLLALSTAGDVLWRFNVEGVLSGVQINQTPAVVGPSVIAVLSSGAVLALDRESGGLVWETRVGPRGKQLTAPVTDGRRLYVGARDGVYALSLKNGEQQWVFRTGSYVSAPPVLSGDVLCIAGNDRHLYGIDPRNGQLLWQTTMPQETKMSPALAEGDAEGPYAVVVDCTGGVVGLSYPVAAANHEVAGRWRKQLWSGRCRATSAVRRRRGCALQRRRASIPRPPIGARSPISLQPSISLR